MRVAAPASQHVARSRLRSRYRNGHLPGRIETVHGESVYEIAGNYMELEICHFCRYPDAFPKRMVPSGTSRCYWRPREEILGARKRPGLSHPRLDGAAMDRGPFVKCHSPAGTNGRSLQSTFYYSYCSNDLIVDENLILQRRRTTSASQIQDYLYVPEIGILPEAICHLGGWK